MNIDRKDILDEMTKEEIIKWVRSQFFRRLPTRSDLLFARWDAQTLALLDEEKAENARFAKLDFAERDRIAKQFNESKCNQERLSLLHKMQPYDNAIQEHVKRSQQFRKRHEKLQKMYEQIDVERSKEGAAA